MTWFQVPEPVKKNLTSLNTFLTKYIWWFHISFILLHSNQNTYTMVYNQMYIDFSLDYDGQCEDISTFEVDGQDFSEDIYFEDVDKFVTELEKLDDFYVSEHRTEVQVFWNEGKMNVKFRYFNEPEDGEFDDHELNGLEPIELVWGE